MVINSVSGLGLTWQWTSLLAAKTCFTNEEKTVILDKYKVKPVIQSKSNRAHRLSECVGF